MRLFIFLLLCPLLVFAQKNPKPKKNTSAAFTTVVHKVDSASASIQTDSIKDKATSSFTTAFITSPPKANLAEEKPKKSNIVLTNGKQKYLDSLARANLKSLEQKINTILANNNLNRNSYQEIKDLFLIVDTIKTDIEAYYYQKDTLYYYDFLMEDKYKRTYWDVDNYINALKIQFKRQEKEKKTSTWRLHIDRIQVTDIVYRTTPHKGIQYFVKLDFEQYFKDELYKEQSYRLKKTALCAIINKEDGEDLPLPKVKIAYISVGKPKAEMFEPVDVHGIFIKKIEDDTKNKAWKLHLIDSLLKKNALPANDHSFMAHYWKGEEFYQRKILKTDAKGVLNVPMPIHSGEYKVNFFSQKEKLLDFSTVLKLDSATSNSAFLRIANIKNTDFFEGDSIEFSWISQNVETFRIDFLGQHNFKNHSVKANIRHKTAKVRAELGKKLKEQSVKVRVIANDLPTNENTSHTYDQEIFIRKKPKQDTQKTKKKPKKKGFWARLFGK